MLAVDGQIWTLEGCLSHVYEIIDSLTLSAPLSIYRIGTVKIISESLIIVRGYGFGQVQIVSVFAVGALHSIDCMRQRWWELFFKWMDTGWLTKRFLLFSLPIHPEFWYQLFPLSFQIWPDLPFSTRHTLASNLFANPSLDGSWPSLFTLSTRLVLRHQLYVIILLTQKAPTILVSPP